MNPITTYFSTKFIAAKPSPKVASGLNRLHQLTTLNLTEEATYNSINEGDHENTLY